jgi:hypothetical protein
MDRFDQHAYELFIEWNFTPVSDRFMSFPMELFTVEKGEFEILDSSYIDNYAGINHCIDFADTVPNIARLLQQQGRK